MRWIHSEFPRRATSAPPSISAVYGLRRGAWIGIIAGVAMAWILGGCTALATRHPAVALPVAPHYPADVIGTPAEQGTDAATMGWRDYFSDPRLRELIAQALDNNRDLRSAVLRVAEARAGYRMQRSGQWPARVTRDPTREKLGAALNINGDAVIAATGGYIGDRPSYQGHVALIARSSGAVTAVFNTLCAGRHQLITPTSCSSSDSAILSRGGVVVEPGGDRLLLSTGNANWNGTTDFGDSVIELTFPQLTLRQAFTPTTQATLNAADLDLGSSAPALLGQNRVLIAGKDAVMRVLNLQRLSGHPPFSKKTLGGEVQTFKTPGGGMLFTAPAVWHHGARTTVFVADGNATAAYALRSGRLHQLWINATPGTSPLVAGGLLYVYNPDAGGIDVYSPGSGHPIARLAGSSGHWNSPIVVDGHVVEPEGNANDHKQSGTITLFSR